VRWRSRVRWDCSANGKACFHIPDVILYLELKLIICGKPRGSENRLSLCPMHWKQTNRNSSLWPYIPLDLGRFFSFWILYTISRTAWTGDQLVARPLPTHRTTQTQNKRTQTSVPRVGFEPTIPVFERAKRIDALDRAATVIARQRELVLQIII
jgi:hypothetical protein